MLLDLDFYVFVIIIIIFFFFVFNGESKEVDYGGGMGRLAVCSFSM